MNHEYQYILTHYNFDNSKFTIVGYNEPQFTLPDNVTFKSLGLFYFSLFSF